MQGMLWWAARWESSRPAGASDQPTQDAPWEGPARPQAQRQGQSQCLRQKCIWPVIGMRSQPEEAVPSSRRKWRGRPGWRSHGEQVRGSCRAAHSPSGHIQRTELEPQLQTRRHSKLHPTHRRPAHPLGPGRAASSGQCHLGQRLGHRLPGLGMGDSPSVRILPRFQQTSTSPLSSLWKLGRAHLGKSRALQPVPEDAFHRQIQPLQTESQRERVRR